MNLSFIIIDDRELDCYIAEKLIDKTEKSVQNRIYFNAIDALKEIELDDTQENTLYIILLDVMMPVISGFEFIERFEKLSENIQRKYRIIPITTSLNKNDLNVLAKYNSVECVLKKPYTFQNFREIILKIEEKYNVLGQ
jgi:CheY-like chemotaxis protein